MAKPKSEQKPGRLENWLDFSQKLYGTLDLDQATRIALNIALQITGMQRGMFLTHESGDSFHCHHAQNREGRTLSPEQFSPMESLLTEVAREGSPVFRSQGSGEAKTALCVPLMSELFSAKKVIAILYFDSPNDFRYGPAEQEAVNVFLIHASPALESVILYDCAVRDSLTRVYNRHYFDAMSQIEWRRTLRHKHPCAALKVDVDHLREYNDLYGRKDGDMVLVKTAEILTEICRMEDLIARYDVDEFAVLLPETDTMGARMVAGRIIEEVPLLLTRDPENPVTVSIGTATFPRCAVSNLSDLMKLADSALLQAKQAGGKRAIVYEPSLSSAHRKIF